MPGEVAQTPGMGRVAVYGASGYTGRLVAAELRRRGAELVLSGRNRAKLEIVAEDIGGAPVEAAALDDPVALRRLLEPCAALIACAGPFSLHGEPLLGAAVETGTHYVDTTGEQPFIRLAFERYGGRAAAAGVALVPAMGFDYAPGDMIAALTAAGIGKLDELVLAYAVRGFGPSRGTASSALGMIAGGDAEWRDGALVEADRSVGRGSFEFPEPLGGQTMVRYPSGEHVTVPRHVPTRTVRTMLTAATVTPHPALSRLAPLTMPAVQLALRTPARRGLEALVGRLPEGPSPENRAKARFTIACEARRGGLHRRGVVSGSDVYGLTARTTVEAALRLAAPGYERRGALAPSQAFDPADFLHGLAGFAVEYEVEPLPAGVAAG